MNGGLGNGDMSSPDTDIFGLRKSDDYQIIEFNHRSKIQKNLMCFVMCISAGLLFAAVGGLFWLIYSNNTDFHMAILVGAFLIPPTVMTIVAVKAAHKEAQDNDATDKLPALNLIKEIAVALKEAFSSAK